MASVLIIATSFFNLARKRALLHLFVATMLVISFSILFLDLGSWVLPTLGRDSTLTGRSALWQQLLRMSSERPFFGVGFESFWLGPRLDKMWSLFSFHPNEAHNGYLEILLNLGWTGVALLAVILVRGYRNVIGMLYRNPWSGRLGLAYWVIGVAYSFTEAGFRMMSPVWIAFLMATMTVPQAFRKDRRAEAQIAESERENAPSEQWALSSARELVPACARDQANTRMPWHRPQILR